MARYEDPFRVPRQQATMQMGAQQQQMRMAQEQWDWQKRLYGEQAAAQKAALPGMERLAATFGADTAAAKRANQERYQRMLGIQRGETARQAAIQQRQLDLVGRTTGQREADIRSEYAGRESDIMQRLARQGMAGTSVAPTMRMGVEREKQSALNRLADTMQGTRLGVLGGMAAPRRGTELGIMERRTDKYPDPNLLMSLATGLGQAGGGSGMTALINALSKMQQ